VEEKMTSKTKCSNCGGPLGESASATLDGNPKHQRMCPSCSTKVLDPMGDAFSQFLESQGHEVVDATPKKINRASRPLLSGVEKIKGEAVVDSGTTSDTTSGLHVVNKLHKSSKPVEIVGDKCQACNGDGVWHQEGTCEHPTPKASTVKTDGGWEKELKKIKTKNTKDGQMVLLEDEVDEMFADLDNLLFTELAKQKADLLAGLPEPYYEYKKGSPAQGWNSCLKEVRKRLEK